MLKLGMFDPTHWYGSGPRGSLHLSALTVPIFPLHVRGGGGHGSGRLGASDVWQLIL